MLHSLDEFSKGIFMSNTGIKEVFLNAVKVVADSFVDWEWDLTNTNHTSNLLEEGFFDRTLSEVVADLPAKDRTALAAMKTYKNFVLHGLTEKSIAEILLVASGAIPFEYPGFQKHYTKNVLGRIPVLFGCKVCGKKIKRKLTEFSIPKKISTDVSYSSLVAEHVQPNSKNCIHCQKESQAKQLQEVFGLFDPTGISTPYKENEVVKVSHDDYKIYLRLKDLFRTGGNRLALPVEDTFLSTAYQDQFLKLLESRLITLAGAWVAEAYFTELGDHQIYISKFISKDRACLSGAYLPHFVFDTPPKVTYFLETPEARRKLHVDYLWGIIQNRMDDLVGYGGSNPSLAYVKEIKELLHDHSLVTVNYSLYSANKSYLYIKQENPRYSRCTVLKGQVKNTLKKICDKVWDVEEDKYLSFSEFGNDHFDFLHNELPNHSSSELKKFKPYEFH